MQTHVIALAAALVAAAAPLAHAQSSVTIYGLIDTWVGQVDTKSDKQTGKAWVDEANGGPATKLGFRGSEETR